MSRPHPTLPVLAGVLAAAALAGATPSRAEVRYLAYDASDRITQALTRGVTLEVEPRLFGGVRVRRLFSTTARGSAGFRRGGPEAVRDALPPGAGDGEVHAIVLDGDGRGLSRALCPGADEAWLVLGRVRAGRPLAMQAVGRWADGRFRHCVALNYAYRGEWATPAGVPGGVPGPGEIRPGGAGRP